MCHFCANNDLRTCTTCGNRRLCADHATQCTRCNGWFCLPHFARHFDGSPRCATRQDTITFAGHQYAVDVFLNGLHLPLQGTLYHDVIWKLQTPLHALRDARTTKDAGFPVLDEQELWNRKDTPQVEHLVSNVGGLLQAAYNLILRGCNPFVCGAGAQTITYDDIPISVTLQCLKRITVTQPAGPTGNWNVALLMQFDNWCAISAPRLVEIFGIRITNHPLRANFFGQSQHLEPATTLANAPLWNLFELFTLRNTLQDNECSDLTIKIWLHIGEMFAAWRTGAVGLRQIYFRLRKVWDFCDAILELLKGSAPDAFQQKDLARMDAIHDLFVAVIETKLWVTRARHRLNGLMRQNLFALPAADAGDRWDVEDWKDSVEGPLVPSYQDRVPIDTGQQALEAHCALALKGSGVLKNTFQTVHRYIKQKGDDGDADYWDAHGFPWDQKLVIEITFDYRSDPLKDLIASILEKLTKELYRKNRTVSANVGIVLDATCCSQQFYERVWDTLYERFDTDFPFWRQGDHFPLFIDAVSTTLIGPCCALQASGLSGLLFQFHQLVAGGTITFDSLTKYCRERCTKIPMDDIKPKDSWDWHRDRKLALPLKGVYFEYGIKYTKFGDTQMRLLIDWRKQRLYCSPLHYSPYVTLNQQNVVRQTGYVQVTGVPAQFWQKF